MIIESPGLEVLFIWAFGCFAPDFPFGLGILVALWVRGAPLLPGIFPDSSALVRLVILSGKFSILVTTLSRDFLMASILEEITL